jgi:hypothetical protein
MCCIDLANGAIKLIDKWFEDKKNKKAEEKQKQEIKNNRLDLKDVIYKMDIEVPKADLLELGNIRAFVVGKQDKLDHRKLIPVQIRNEGNAVYSASISRIDELRKKFLNAA